MSDREFFFATTCVMAFKVMDLRVLAPFKMSCASLSETGSATD